MKPAAKVLCIGELLIDFFCSDIGVRLTEGQHFVKKAGGAPANVAAAIARLGGRAAFVGKVGADPFGRFLKQTLDEVQVDTSALILDPRFPTTLAFVSLQADGERDFVFHRGADEQLAFAEIDSSLIREAEIFHFGSATALLGGPLQETYGRLFHEALALRRFVSFDPNYRGDLWKGREAEFVALARQYIAKADFVKVSEEELELIAGEGSRKAGVRKFHEWGASVVAVTLGKQGTFLSVQGKMQEVASVPVQAVDATGAGDAFVGAVLFQLSRKADPKATLGHPEEWVEMIAFANKVGALVCTRMGAISALPTYDEVVNA